MPIANAYAYDDYLALPIHEQPWIVKPLIPVNGMICLHGHAKTRKSFLAIQLARDICNGEKFLGFETRTGNVLYIQVDTPRALWQLRFKDLETNAFGLSAEGKKRFYLADTESAPFPFHVTTPQVSQWLRNQVELVKPDLVIIDVIRKIFAGNDNDSDVLEQVLSAAKHACNPAAVLMIAHSKKAKEGFDSGTIGEIRGSSAQGASYDTIMRLQKASKNRGPLLTIEGRATEDTEIRLKNRADLLFDLGTMGAFDLATQDLLLQSFPSERKRAEALANLTGESFDKCHAALRRMKK